MIEFVHDPDLGSLLITFGKNASRVNGTASATPNPNIPYVKSIAPPSSHPGGKVKFTVNILDDELTIDLMDFELFSEQWYVHFDPNIDIIATTTFDGKYYPEIDGVVMPIAWKKFYGKGKIFCLTIGHDPDEFINEENAWKLLTRGLKWATR